MTSPLTPEMVSLLTWLKERAKKGKPPRQAEAAEKFSVSQQAMSGRLFALESKGLIRKELATVKVPMKAYVFLPVEEE